MKDEKTEWTRESVGRKEDDMAFLPRVEEKKKYVKSLGTE
jgi:hypothetical protein